MVTAVVTAQGGRGESWSPDFSTVLQVLISIQVGVTQGGGACWGGGGLPWVQPHSRRCLAAAPSAPPRTPLTLCDCPCNPLLPLPAPPLIRQSLILVDEPWYNEPGYEQRTDSTASDRYSAGLM